MSIVIASRAIIKSICVELVHPHIPCYCLKPMSSLIKTSRDYIEFVDSNMRRCSLLNQIIISQTFVLDILSGHQLHHWFKLMSYAHKDISQDN